MELLFLNDSTPDQSEARIQQYCVVIDFQIHNVSLNWELFSSEISVLICV